MRFIWAFLLAGTVFAAEPGRIYTQPEPAATGGIAGKTDCELRHALAVDQERARVYRAELSASDTAFQFTGLPVGKYDLVLITKAGTAYEGLTLGQPIAALPAVAQTNLARRIARADAFFNRHIVHRSGVEGNTVFALVERLRDQTILKQSGEKLDAHIRRFEVIELQLATDDWQMVRTRHIYRETEERRNHPPFSRHVFVPALGHIRVVDARKELGMLALPNP